MEGEVFVSGIGMVSAIGMNIPETLQSLYQSKSGIGAISILDTHLADTLPVGEIKYTDLQLKNLLNNASSKRTYSRTTLLAIQAMQEATQMAELGSIERSQAALISATSIGGMDKGEIFYADFLKNPEKANYRYARVHDCGSITEELAEQAGIQSYIATSSTACSSAANAIIHAIRLIQHGMYDMVIAGGADALCNFTLNGFHSLMILSDEPCRPFDKNRKGLNLGEGAAFLVLESRRSLTKSGRKPLCQITGYANTCEAYHQTASAPDGSGAYSAMVQALQRSKLTPADISYINTHGTATPTNDLSEGRAIEKLFGENVPPFSSTKALTGHTLAAAGGLEAVLSILSINHSLIYPNLNFSDPMDELTIKPEVALGSSQTIKHVLSNSFGFGGNNSSLVFSRC
ncbi:beta-ketoacyl-[acyl-carrier-protein] synthase family protein [Cytophagaceae bacterium DM2B3-1]|uniref:Beta-ketoacyl-[acyl-carrier-protein] synthase family protein n=1 Tax=Xanthocytophaga flava TaxID=3048013 RepID=A0ABT7CVK5_9BACT|nr:beta-ketoacyl-[acyl-carrier-protein] synthase family protein [Xanthocytophaga flavus]MDJ1496970.1 beta-ketoacyl-[acyl-carrier-protein] synthase family protein [Xanthocytophaga flavus]